MVAFARTLGAQAVIAVAPRLMRRLAGGAMRAPLGDEAWHETRLVLPGDLAGHSYLNLYSGETLLPDRPSLPLAAVFAHFPVALLASR